MPKTRKETPIKAINWASNLKQTVEANNLHKQPNQINSNQVSIPTKFGSKQPNKCNEQKWVAKPLETQANNPMSHAKQENLSNNEASEQKRQPMPANKVKQASKSRTQLKKTSQSRASTNQAKTNKFTSAPS